MKYRTSTGALVSARSRNSAELIAVSLGLGTIVGIAPAPVSEPMSLERARRLAAQANEWPRCGDGWPATKTERAAALALA